MICYHTRFLIFACTVFAWSALIPVAYSQEILNLNTRIELQPASNINTKHLEYAPMYYGNGMIFVQAKDQGKEQVIDIKLGMPFYELMYAEFGPDGMPGNPKNFSANIRTRFHEGPASFTNDLQHIFFTRQNTSNGRNVQDAENKTNLKIYLADKGAEDWENVREMPFCSDDYSVQCPTLSPDNQQIIFMSDKPGGYGGWDLYISDRYAGSWSEPVNLGPTINTDKYERLPYWHSRGVLFFSSNGHGGSGGLDMFASRRLDDGSWSEPVNLGPKFNSRQDDLSFICDEDGKSGFFASARKSGLGRDDIYHFTSDESIFATALLDETSLTAMTLAVREEYSQNPVPDAAVWIFPVGPFGPEGLDAAFTKNVIQNPDGTETLQLLPKDITGVSANYRSDVKGKVPVRLRPSSDYFVVVSRIDYVQKQLTLQRASIGTGNEYFIDMESMEPLDVDLTPDKDCITTGGMVIAASSGVVLPGVLVQVRSTCTGSAQVLETDEHGRFRTCLIPGCAYQVRLLKDGFLTQEYRYQPGTDDANRTIRMTEEDLEVRTGGTPVAGDVLVLDHIYYDFNKSAIRTGDARELESLAKMMLKYPSMTIELQSHTDSRGTAEYNMELSEKRGESVREFLITRGVQSSRIQLKPMGEGQLRNNCADGVQCTDEEHQQNRRTEIKILSMDGDLQIEYPDR